MGALRRENALFDASICKRYKDRQIAFYYSGVGNKLENSQIGQFFGGATGLGATDIVERAYLDIISVYRPGDRIFLFGFSRGAAVARLLARTIDERAAPKRMLTLRLLGRHWVIWRSQDSREVPISVLGCWDTVGSFGIAKTVVGINFQQIDLFKNLDVPYNVLQAYHMVALDETRDSFEPTLMEPDPIKPERIIEVWFSGNHANVGGGYATDKLSDVTLDFMLRHVSSGYAHDEAMKPGEDNSWGLYLSAVKKNKRGEPGGGKKKDIVEIDPDPLGELRMSTGIQYSYAPRRLPLHAVISETVFQRMKHATPNYAPPSLFNLNRNLLKQLETVRTEVTCLKETNSLNDEECQAILVWSQETLSLKKSMIGISPTIEALKVLANNLHDQKVKAADNAASFSPAVAVPDESKAQQLA